MFNIYSFLVNVIAIMLCLAVHEAAHGFIAYLLGDDTAKNSGRITLNPLRHIDVFGMLCLMFFGFGWGKPVVCDTKKFKHPSLYMAITALAGPLSNFLFGFLLIFLAVLFRRMHFDFMTAAADFLNITASLSVYLGVFNLIPVPPLDGSKVLFLILPKNAVRAAAHYEQYFIFVLIILLYSGVIRTPLIAAADYAYTAIAYPAAFLANFLARLF